MRAFEGAIRLAIAATDYERVGLLIARHWYGYVSAGQAATVQRWLESLPEEMITHDATLALVRRGSVPSVASARRARDF